jgi:hypothetical protein
MLYTTLVPDNNPDEWDLLQVSLDDGTVSAKWIWPPSCYTPWAVMADAVRATGGAGAREGAA